MVRVAHALYRDYGAAWQRWPEVVTEPDCVRNLRGTSYVNAYKVVDPNSKQHWQHCNTLPWQAAPRLRLVRMTGNSTVLDKEMKRCRGLVLVAIVMLQQWQCTECRC